MQGSCYMREEQCEYHIGSRCLFTEFLCVCPAPAGIYSMFNTTQCLLILSPAYVNTIRRTGTIHLKVRLPLRVFVQKQAPS